MPRPRPATSGYARLSQADDEDEHHDPYSDSFHEDGDPHVPPRTISLSRPQYASAPPPRPSHMRLSSDASSAYRYRRRPPGRGHRSNSGVDIKAINARLEKWAEEIASKFKIHKIRGKSRDEEHLEIHHSVFQPPEGVRPVTQEQLHAEEEEEDRDGRMNPTQFHNVVESVRTAIEMGVHPTMISQGSSGSYFARNSDGKVVGVFKPKDEEPYASRNPKWTKWIHRNLFPCFFGRACLIPNLSYVSEAAACVVDRQLRTNIVPYTDVVYLSSKSFYYDFWQRSAYYRRRKPLPEKPGSFQVFLKGFKDANVFLRDHPWPDQVNSGFRTQDAPPQSRRPWTENVRPQNLLGRDADAQDDIEPPPRSPASPAPPNATPAPKFEWTPQIQQAFREELEKLVILDYIMRNTDRGPDNWMVKVDWGTQEVSIAADPPKANGSGNGNENPFLTPPNPSSQQDLTTAIRSASPLPATVPVKIELGAIDNSLSWPWKHPDAWRSFPFGWLFLPVSLIGQPFSQKTRDHFLPLLTSSDWWSETQVALRRVFERDSDFKERMFARQMAVMKGQAWNVVETLKTPDHGPLELTRRTRVCVWDDLVDIPVAIPMRNASAESRRQHQASLAGLDDEEMDIAAANGSPPRPKDDLLKLSPTDLPNPNRFELSRNPSGTDLGQMYEGPQSPATIHGEPVAHGRERKDFVNGTNLRPDHLRSKTRIDPHEQSSANHPPVGHRRSSERRFSGRRRRSSGGRGYDMRNPFLGGDDSDEDEDDGDLGYIAARVTEKNTRKVIVERLEAVKSKNPVFTCC